MAQKYESKTGSFSISSDSDSKIHMKTKFIYFFEEFSKFSIIFSSDFVQPIQQKQPITLFSDKSLAIAALSWMFPDPF